MCFRHQRRIWPQEFIPILGEGRYPMCFRHQPSPRGEGARRRRAGEGLLGRSSKPRVKQFPGALFCSWAGLVEATSVQRIGTEQRPSICEFGFKLNSGVAPWMSPAKAG